MFTALAGMSAQASTGTSLALQSQPGDYIGQGQTLLYTAPADNFSVNATASGINVTVSGTGSQDTYTISLLPPAGRKLRDGVYENAQRAAFHAPGLPGMEVDGGDRGCNTVTGRFELFDVHADQSGTLVSFVLEFEQHCEGATPALFGQLVYNASGPAGTYVSVAGADVTKGEYFHSTGYATISLSQPSSSPVSVSYATADKTAKQGVDYLPEKGVATIPAGATSTQIRLRILGNDTATHGRNFLVNLSAPMGAQNGASSAAISIIDPNAPLTVMALNSQPGDYIGGGIPWLELPSYTSFTTSASTGLASVMLGEPDFWTLDFASPSGSPLVPGTYLNAQRYPFEPSGSPGLSVYGAGRGCNTLTGQFTVKQIVDDMSGGLSQFSTDFQQNCEGGNAALFGSVRINAVLSQVSVTDGKNSPDTATFYVTVYPAASTPTYVQFQTVDGTAVAGTDYTGVSTLVRIPAGKLHAKVAVPLLAHGADGHKMFYGQITSPDLPVVWNGLGVFTF